MHVCDFLFSRQKGLSLNLNIKAEFIIAPGPVIDPNNLWQTQNFCTRKFFINKTYFCVTVGLIIGPRTVKMAQGRRPRAIVAA